MAEALLRRRLADRGVEARVSSAGVVRGGEPASPGAVQALAQLGIDDLSAHRSRLLRTPLVRDADLVLGLAREHVREAAVIAPDAFPRMFTLKELARRVAKTAPRVAGEPFDHWLATVAGGRQTSDLLGADPADDVADPLGSAASAYAAVAAEIDHALAIIVDGAWGSAGGESAGSGQGRGAVRHAGRRS
jgi:protein-tyrosine phosphatase